MNNRQDLTQVQKDLMEYNEVADILHKRDEASKSRVIGVLMLILFILFGGGTLIAGFAWWMSLHP